MAEAAGEAPDRDDSATSFTPNGDGGGGYTRIPRVRPPDKKKYEEEMEVLSTAIKAKEAQLKALNSRAEDGAQNELHGLRIDKDSTIGRRKKIDNSLRNINQEIAKQMVSLNTLQATLQYKNEERINEVIRRLEHQLKTNNFSLRDEKKIVANIDQLKRSRHSLVQYNALKKEIDGMRDRQRRMREERDHLFKKVTALKAQEDAIKKSFSTNKERIDKLKKDIEDLKGQKSTLFMDFKNQEEEFRQARDAYRKMKNSEYKQKKEEERRIQMEAYQKELEEYEASREPYEDEKLLCATLITYLQKFLLSEGESEAGSLPADGGGDAPVLMRGESRGESLSPSGDHPSGMYLLRKKQEDDPMFGGVVRPKTNKRSKRDKRRSFNRPIVHTPQIFSQFASLHLSAPPNVAEVMGSIEQLQNKKKYFENLPPPNPSILVDGGAGVGGASSLGGNTSDGSAGAPSVAESAICESIPSTPETMLDPPRFPGGGSVRGAGGGGVSGSLEESGGWPRLRKLSKDSGTELEEMNGSSCDEFPNPPPGGEEAEEENEEVTTLNPRDLDFAHAADDVISSLSLEAASALVTSSAKIELTAPSFNGATEEGEGQILGNSGSVGNQGNNDDVTNTSSSTSTTPTNSVDNLESPPVVAAGSNNNNNVVATEESSLATTTTSTTTCQNQQQQESPIATDANSNPDLRGNDSDVTTPASTTTTTETDDVTTTECDDVTPTSGHVSKLEVVLSGLVASPEGVPETTTPPPEYDVTTTPANQEAVMAEEEATPSASS